MKYFSAFLHAILKTFITLCVKHIQQSYFKLIIEKPQCGQCPDFDCGRPTNILSVFLQRRKTDSSSAYSYNSPPMSVFSLAQHLQHHYTAVQTPKRKLSSFLAHILLTVRLHSRVLNPSTTTEEIVLSQVEAPKT